MRDRGEASSERGAPAKPAGTESDASCFASKAERHCCPAWDSRPSGDRSSAWDEAGARRHRSGSCRRLLQWFSWIVDQGATGAVGVTADAETYRKEHASPESVKYQRFRKGQRPVTLRAAQEWRAKRAENAEPPGTSRVVGINHEEPRHSYRVGRRLPQGTLSAPPHCALMHEPPVSPSVLCLATGMSAPLRNHRARSPEPAGPARYRRGGPVNCAIRSRDIPVAWARGSPQNHRP